MEAITQLTDVFLHWLSDTTEKVLTWSMVIIQAISSLLYSVSTDAIKTAIAIFHKLVNSVQWLFQRVSENGFAYILGLMAIAIAVMLILLIRLLNQTSSIEHQNRDLRNQNRNLQSRVDSIQETQKKAKEQQERQAAINAFAKLVQLLLQW